MKRSDLVYVVLVVLLLFIIGDRFFSEINEPEKSSNVNPSNLTQTEVIRPVNYGNGVYYFSSRPENFGLDLSNFLQDNPGEVSAISNDDRSPFLGYFVVIKK